MHTKLITLTAIVAVCAIPDVAAATAPAPATFSSTNAEQTYTVPAGVKTVHVTAVGAPGGAGAAGRAPGRIIGGLGAVVGADLNVTPGEVLYVEVGGAGGLGDADTGGLPGWNGGGAGGDTSAATGAFGGGGGGASDVRLCSIAAANCPQGSSLGSRVLVAGGGGGGGGGQVNGDLGGQGGNAGQVGSAGSDRTGHGGGGATQSTAGTGGFGAPCGNQPDSGSPGTDGSAGGGGTGGSGNAVYDTGWGGGGGGGYFGGGGGGDGGYNACAGGGAGGGGGSSFGPDGTTFSTAIRFQDAPSITIAPLEPQAHVTPSSLMFAAQAPSTVSSPQTVTVANTGSAPLSVSGVSFSGPAHDDFFMGSSTCGGAVAPGASCELTIRFTPAATGTRVATLTLASNDPAGPAAVSLTGTGATASNPAVAPQEPSTSTSPSSQTMATGQVKLIACRKVSVRTTHGRRRVTRCTSPRLSPNASFVVGSTPARAVLTRRGAIIATGISHGRVLTLRASGAVPRGTYTLTLVYGSRRTTMTITVR